MLSTSGYQLDLLRLDLVHQHISGNKWFKLKYNIAELLRLNKTALLTFGGPFSNHIAATAEACALYGIKSIGCIRGDAFQVDNPTLQKAKLNGMELHFLNREHYQLKNEEEFQAQLKKQFGDVYIVPEGGSNNFGIQGCKEILKDVEPYGYILCACGTGSTYTGLLLSGKATQAVVGISVLKGNNLLPERVEQYLLDSGEERKIKITGSIDQAGNHIQHHCIDNRYAFSGYAGFDPELIQFKREFEQHHGLQLDHIYTVKLAYGIMDLIKHHKFRSNSSILMVHSGGLQGNAGFENRYRKRLIL